MVGLWLTCFPLPHNKLSQYKMKGVEKERCLKGIWGSGLEPWLPTDITYRYRLHGFLFPHLSQRWLSFHISSVNVTSVFAAVGNFLSKEIQLETNIRNSTSLRLSGYHLTWEILPTTDVFYSFVFFPIFHDFNLKIW